jgi:hypothetical protein
LVVPESDCFMLIKQVDSNGDGALSLTDFMKLMMPSTYTCQQNMRSAKKNHVYGARPKKMTHEIEFGVMQVLQR